jgi:magnesium transporter
VHVLTSLDRDRIAGLLAAQEYFWLDLESPSDDEVAALGELLQLHPLALEDTREFRQRPKLDRYGDAVLLVFYSARATEDGVPQLLEVHLHVSGDWLVTVRRDPSEGLDRLHEMLVPEDVPDEDYAVYRVLDELTDAVYSVVDRLEDRIDTLEAEVLRLPDRHLLAVIYRAKQDVQHVLRTMLMQRDQFGVTTGVIHDLPGLSHGSRAYMADIRDHLAQLVGELHRQSDDLTALTGTYFNANQNRLNLTATRLTVLATFFLVWTLVTSFFGQNFGWLVRHISSFETFAIFGVGGLLVPTIPVGVFFWRRRQDWL